MEDSIHYQDIQNDRQRIETTCKQVLTMRPSCLVFVDSFNGSSCSTKENCKMRIITHDTVEERRDIILFRCARVTMIMLFTENIFVVI